jgi:(2Fe-2S) ferredoxin
MPDADPRTLFVCLRNRHGKGASCAGRGAREMLEAMRSLLATEGLSETDLAVRPTGCLGLCKQGPVAVAAVGTAAAARKPKKVKKKQQKKATVFTRIDPADIRGVLQRSLAADAPPRSGTDRKPRSGCA